MKKTRTDNIITSIFSRITILTAGHLKKNKFRFSTRFKNTFISKNRLAENAHL